ncbi:MAG: NADPH-dependent FMN reductase [Rhodovibrionaceae bacterium]|nr:NADPH-dependent FMN reductase [Rhodovibrionaceae bacterium]
MTTLIGLSGSARQKSLNTALLRTMAELAPEGVEIAVETIAGIPLYDGDTEESEGVPQAVETLKDKIAAADGLILVSPEYNNSIPGPFKNAIDWLSRPPKDIGRVFRGRPVALAGATPGGMGTLLAQNAWLPVVRTLGMRPWFGGRITASRANTMIGDSGLIEDDGLRDQIKGFVEGFASFVTQPH